MSSVFEAKAGAVNTTWTGGTSSDWTISGNWNNGVPNTDNGSIITIAATPTNQPDIGAGTITIGLLVMETGASISGTGTLRLDGATMTVNSNEPTPAAISCNLAILQSETFTINDDATADPDLEISGILSGAFNIIKQGAGTLMLSGANTYSGTNSVTAGTLMNGASNAVSNNTVTVSDGAVYNLNGFNETIGALNVNGATTGGLVATGSGTLTLGGTITTTGTAASITGILNLGGADRTIATGTTPNAVTISAVIEGANGIIKSGTGALTLAGANTYDGTTAINQGSVKLGISSSSATSGPLGSNVGGTTVTSGETLDLNGFSLTGSATEALSLNGIGLSSVGALTNTGVADAGFAGDITLTAAATIEADAATGALTLTGNISGDFALTLRGTGSGELSGVRSGNGSATIVINDGSTWTLSGANSHTGATTITLGTLKLGTAGNGTNSPLGTTGAATSIAAAGILDLNGITLSTAEAITLTGSNASIINTGASAVYSGNISGNVLLIIGGTGDVNYTGIRSGSGGITKNNGNTWTLSNDNTYSGVTTITTGTIKLGANGGATNTPLGTTVGGTTIAAGGALDLNGFTLGTAEGITSMAGTGVSGGGAITNTGVDAAYSGAIVLVTPGASVKTTTSGTLTLSSAISGAFPLTLDGDGTGTYSGVRSGTSTIVKEGSGDWTLSNVASTYSGATTITLGTLKLGSAGGATNTPLGTTAGGTTIASGGALDLNGFILGTAEGITSMAGTGVSGGGALTNTGGNASYSGNIVLVSPGASIETTTSGTLTLSGGISGDFPLTLDGDGTGTYSGVRSGTSTIVKEGTGIWTLSNVASSYSGATTVNAGTLRLGSAGGATNTPLGTTGTGTTVNTGAVLDLNGFTLGTAEGLTLNGAGLTASPAGALTNTGATASYSGDITLGAAATITATTSGNLTCSGTVATGAFALNLDGASTAVGTMSGIISTPTALNKNGAGTWTLSNANSYSGTTTLNLGQLNINSTSAIGSGAFVINGGTIDNTTGGAITLSTNNAITIGANFAFAGTQNLNFGTGAITNTATSRTITISGTNRTLTFGGQMTNGFAGTQTTTVNGAGHNFTLGSYALSNSSTSYNATINGTGNVTISGIISNGGTATASSLTYSGSGVLVIAGANTYGGATTVSSGILRLGIPGVIPDASALTVGGTLDLFGYNETVGSLAGTGTVSSSFTGTLTLTAGGDNSNTTWSGSINNGSATSVALVKNGSGALTLSTANTYTGGTTLNAGTLNINNAAALGASGAFIIAGGSIDNTSGADITTNNYTLSLNGDFTYTGSIPRNLNLGTGAVTMSGSRQFTVSAGTLTIGGVINNSAQNITKAGSGTLSFGSQALSVNDVTINAGTFVSTSNTLTLNGNFANSGTFTHNSGTVNFNRAGTQSIGAATFNNLTCGNSGTKTATGNITTSGLLTLSSVHLGLGSNIVTINGTLAAMSGSNAFSANGSSSLVVGGSGALGSSIFFDQSSSGITNRIVNLTYNRTSATGGNAITIGNNLHITGTITPTTGELAAGGNLFLISDGSGTATIASGGCTTCSYITGNVNIQRFIPAVARRYRFMGSTVQSTTLADWQTEVYVTGAGGAGNGFDATTTNAPSVYWYDETMISGNLNTGWTAATNTSNALTVGRGYRVFVRGDRSDPGRLTGAVGDQNAVTMDLVGVPNQGNIAIPVSLTNSGSGGTVYDANNDGWNMVSNPFACGYNWNAHYDDSTTHANIQPVVWTLSGQSGGYVSYNAFADAGSLTSGIIPGGASFWVKANNTGVPNLTFKEQYKITSAPLGIFKTGEGENFRIRLFYDSITYDDATVKYMAGSTVSYDDFDIRKLAGTVTLGIYGDDNIHLDLSVRPPTLVNDTIKLNVSGANGAYNLLFTNGSQIAVAEHVYLFDTYLSTVTDLKTTSTYPFSIVGGVPASTGLNRFYIVISNNASLPVKLLQFSARKTNNKQVRLNWSTAQEINSKQFDVERSADGKRYNTIATIAAGGNTNKLVNYTAMDAHPMRSNYYRLKQVDHDGTFTYSQVEYVMMEEVAGARLYPIPAKETLTIEHDNVLSNISIIDITGKTVLSNKGGMAIYNLDVSSLHTGVYIVEYTDETGNVFREKFTKE
ncbi:MAG: autotransporter-associated beta strand repeat-containing protein [Bacteroidota bacterium]